MKKLPTKFLVEPEPIVNFKLIPVIFRERGSPSGTVKNTSIPPGVFIAGVTFSQVPSIFPSLSNTKSPGHIQEIPGI